MRGGKPLTLNAIGSGECFQRPAEAHEQFEKRSVVGAVGSKRPKSPPPPPPLEETPPKKEKVGTLDINDSHALLLALMLAATILVSVYVAKGGRLI